MNRYEWIANQAYRLWEKAGRPSGRDLDFWLAAENEHDHSQRRRSDSREKEDRREEEGQEKGRPQYGLRELRPTDKRAAGKREREHEQPP
jgi:Protein of unknown function (DUF2934)